MRADSRAAPADTSDLPPGAATPRPNAGDPESLSKDVRFDLLKNRRRRDVLRYLRNRDEVVTLSDLVEHVAATENGITAAQLNSRQRKRVNVALYQCHLPILARADVVDFDRASGLVERTERATQLVPYLAGDRPADASWATRYLQTTLAGGLAYFIVALVPWLSGLAPYVVAVLVGAVGAFALTQLATETGLTTPAALGRLILPKAVGDHSTSSPD